MLWNIAKSLTALAIIATLLAFAALAVTIAIG